MKLKPVGVSAVEIECPACGDIIHTAALTESQRRPAEVHVIVDVAPVKEHIEQMHPEVEV